MDSIKVKTKPIQFEIEVYKIEGEIPEEYIDDFKEWLADKPLHEYGLGRNHEYYSLDNGDDIGISFYIRKVTEIRMGDLNFSETLKTGFNGTVIPGQKQ